MMVTNMYDGRRRHGALSKNTEDRSRRRGVENRLFLSTGLRGLSTVLMLLVLACSLTLSACGYRFSVEGRGPVIGERGGAAEMGPRVLIAIPTIENRTFQANLEYAYTEYLQDEFVVAGGAQVVEHLQEADYVLKGAIQSVTLPTLTFSANQTQESRVVVVVKVEAADRESGAIVWREQSQGSAEFFVGSASASDGSSGGLQFNRVLQDRALEQAGQFVAEDLADRFHLARMQGTFSSQAPDVPSASSTAPTVPEIRQP